MKNKIELDKAKFMLHVKGWDTEFFDSENYDCHVCSKNFPASQDGIFSLECIEDKKDFKVHIACEGCSVAWEIFFPSLQKLSPPHRLEKFHEFFKANPLGISLEKDRWS